MYSLRMFDRTGDEGDMLDQEHIEDRGRKAPFEAGLSNLSSSEPIQNLSFNLTSIAYFSHKHRSPPNYNTIHIIYLISDLNLIDRLLIDELICVHS